MLRLDKKHMEACKERSEYNFETRKMLLQSQTQVDVSQEKAKAAQKEAARLKAENAAHVKNKKKHRLEV